MLNVINYRLPVSYRSLPLSCFPTNFTYANFFTPKDLSSISFLFLLSFFLVCFSSRRNNVYMLEMMEQNEEEGEK